LTLAAVEQLPVPVILQPIFSQRLRASEVSLPPRRHCWQPFEDELQLTHLSPASIAVNVNAMAMLIATIMIVFFIDPPEKFWYSSMPVQIGKRIIRGRASQRWFQGVDLKLPL